MKNLIEALTIFSKYTQTHYPANCSHDQLAIMDVSEEQVSAEDKERLEDLGFFWSDCDEAFISFRFGSG